MASIIPALLFYLLLSSTGTLAKPRKCVKNHRKVAERTTEVRLKKTTFNLYGEKIPGQQVLTTGEHPLNRLAKKLDRDFDGLKLVCSELIGEGFGKAAYVYSQNIVLIPQSALSNETPSQSLLHELVHARIWAAVRNKEPCVFKGLASNRLPEYKNRNYGEGFGIDEVVATLFSVKENLEIMKRELEGAKNSKALAAFSGVVGSMEEVKVYTGRLETLLEILQRGISDGTFEGQVPTPTQLAFLPEGVHWQEIGDENIRLWMSVDVSKEQLNDIVSFSKSTRAILGEADGVAFRLQQNSSASSTNRRKVALEYIDLIESIIDSFSAAFPYDAKAFDAVDPIRN